MWQLSCFWKWALARCHWVWALLRRGPLWEDETQQGETDEKGRGGFGHCGNTGQQEGDAAFGEGRAAHRGRAGGRGIDEIIGGLGRRHEAG